MRFSIVIPALNEEGYITRAITSLKKQTVPRESYEIIVIDNGSDDQTIKTAYEAGADIIRIELCRGTNTARQCGVTESSGDIVAFLDADTIVPPDWLAHIEKNLLQNGVAATSGPYDGGFNGFQRTIDVLYTQRIIPIVPHILEFFFKKPAAVLIGGNFAAWRWVIDKIGGLPPRTFCGDDAAIAMHIVRRVGTVFFDTTLIAKTSPRRFERDGMFMTAYRYAKVYFKEYFTDLPRLS